MDASTHAGSNLTVDPITLEIIGGTVESTRKEMELQIERTARSVVIREGRDYRAAIFDRQGRNISSASGAAHVDPILQNYDITDVEEGDVFIWNDPFKSAGGLTHLPDLCITRPVFWQGELVAYAQAYGHVTDIGGLTPGSVMIGATDIHQEGIIIPPVKIFSRGEVIEPLYKLILNNSRYPDDVQGDLDAEIMACNTGAERIRGLFERYGPEVVDACFEELLERCARALRAVAFPSIPDGSYPFEDFIEIAGAVPQEKRKFIRLKVTMIKEGDHVTFDFTGTDKQSLAAINIAGDERYYVKYVVSIFRNMLPDTIFNGGATRAISCVLPRGTVLSAEYPASASCRAFTLFRLPELCLGALGRAVPDLVTGSSDTRSVWGIAAKNDEGKSVFFRDCVGGGGGGRAEVDGSDALNGNIGGRSIPAEFMEAFYPMIVEWDRLPTDSGGAGTHRGGLGVERMIRFTSSGVLHMHDDRLQTQPWGIKGGKAGKGATYILNPGADDEEVFSHKIDYRPLKAGDRLLGISPGGGGWGDPLDRDPERVAEDVQQELVSRQSALNDYGVVLDDAGRRDADATAARRDKLRRARGPVASFDRGTRFADRLAAGDLTQTVDNA